MKSEEKKGLNVADQLELSILRIAFLIASLDGKIDESEYDFFGQLLSGSHIASGSDLLDVVKITQRSAEKIARLANVEKSRRKILRAFMDTVDSFCPWINLADEPVLVRKAFAVWTAMAMADGDYCEMERQAIRVLQERINSIPRISDEYLSSVESQVQLLSSIRHRIERTSNSASKMKLRLKAQKIVASMDVF